MGDPYRLTSQHNSPSRIFEDLAIQLFRHVIDPLDVGHTLRGKVSVEGDTPEQVLQQWIIVLLDLLQVQKMVLSQFRVIEYLMPAGRPWVLTVEVLGELIDPLRHTLSSGSGSLQCRRVRWTSTAAGFLADVEVITS